MLPTTTPPRLPFDILYVTHTNISGSAQAAGMADNPLAGGDLDWGVLDGLLGFHLRMASAAVARDFAAAMGDLDLTQKQFAVMELISANPGLSQVDIGQALGTDRATMMALIDRLDARGLVVRRRSARDGRRQELSLTAEGAALMQVARSRIAAHEKRFLSGIGPEEAQTLLDALRRLSRA